MTSAHGHRTEIMNMSMTTGFDKRISVTAADNRSPPKLFSP
jgi:hypothetical protein